MSRLRNFLLVFLSLALLAGCQAPPPKDDQTLHILATTYPVYLFTTAVVGDTEGVEVELLVNSQTSCLHDYTLTVKDMKAIEQADVIVMNGVGLEDFMADALARSNAAVVDCSENVALLPTLEHEDHDGHDHEEEYDPHYWMDPRRAAGMMAAISDGLAKIDPGRSDRYFLHEVTAYDKMGGLSQDMDAALFQILTVTGKPTTEGLWNCDKLITFHDGFQYFADAFGLELLKAIEEEEGATVSAAEIREITALIEENHIPAIFVEKSGSRKTADVIARETGCSVYELDMLMSGDGQGIQPYLDAIDQNLTTVLEAFS